MHLILIHYSRTLFDSHKDLPFLLHKKNRKSRKTCLYLRREGKICHTYKSFKASIK